MTIRSRWARVNRRELVDPITVETRHGGGGLGPALEAPVDVRGRARLGRELTRGDDGETVEGKLTLALAPVLTPVPRFGDTDPSVELDTLALFTLGSRVTAAGLSGVVLAVATAGTRGHVERVTVTVG